MESVTSKSKRIKNENHYKEEDDEDDVKGDDNDSVKDDIIDDDVDDDFVEDDKLGKKGKKEKKGKGLNDDKEMVNFVSKYSSLLVDNKINFSSRFV